MRPFVYGERLTNIPCQRWGNEVVIEIIMMQCNWKNLIMELKNKFINSLLFLFQVVGEGEIWNSKFKDGALIQ